MSTMSSLSTSSKSKRKKTDLHHSYQQSQMDSDITFGSNYTTSKPLDNREIRKKSIKNILNLNPLQMSSSSSNNASDPVTSSNVGVVPQSEVSSEYQ